MCKHTKLKIFWIHKETIKWAWNPQSEKSIANYVSDRWLVFGIYK